MMREWIKELITRPMSILADEPNEDVFTLDIDGECCFQACRIGLNSYRVEVIKDGKIYVRHDVEIHEVIILLAEVYADREVPEGFRFYMEVKSDD